MTHQRRTASDKTVGVGWGKARGLFAGATSTEAPPRQLGLESEDELGGGVGRSLVRVLAPHEAEHASDVVDVLGPDGDAVGCL